MSGESLSHDIARSHLETLIERITGVSRAVPDEDNDYPIRIEGAAFYARIDGDQVPIIRLFSVVAAGVMLSSEVLEAVNSINTQLTFLRAVWVSGQVIIEGESVATRTDTDDFFELCRRVADATDHFGPQIVAEFGGEARFEESKDAAYHPPAPHHPGYL